MPQAADQKHNDLIQILPQFSFSIPSQRDIKIVPEPACEADMPAAPQLDKACAGERTAEVFYDIYAENCPDADGDVGTGRKITVQLITE